MCGIIGIASDKPVSINIINSLSRKNTKCMLLVFVWGFLLNQWEQGNT